MIRAEGQAHPAMLVDEAVPLVFSDSVLAYLDCGTKRNTPLDSLLVGGVFCDNQGMTIH